jgi:glyoxylate reductase
MVSDRIDKKLIDSCPNLRVISNCGVGYENIDVTYATEKGIFVTNTPGVLTETTADLVWALMFSVARRIVEGDSFIREGRFKGWRPTLLMGVDVYGKTLGIYGMGRIGTAVGRRAKGFGMRVIYHNRRRNEESEREVGAMYVDFPTLLEESDFLVITAPLNDDTRGRFGLKEFRRMKRTSILINVGRGQTVREGELATALREGVILGAGLDVYEREPLVEEGLLGLKNAVLLPHLGSASRETRERMADMAVEGVDTVLRGRVPRNLVNPGVIRK